MPATISLAKKSTGADVSQWQGLLTAAGFPVTVNGTFDALTDSATRAWQTSKGLVSDGVVGPASWGAMLGTPQPGGTDKNAAYGRNALEAAWPTILAEAAQSQYPEVRALAAMGPPNLAELQIAGAMSHLESGYGKDPYTNKLTNETKVINNWGAIQAGKPPCPPGVSFEVTDTGPNGAYQHCYKQYATPTEGAVDLLRLMTTKRPASWALMKTGDIDAWSIQMHSWKPPLTSLGQGKPAGTVQNLDPITKMPGYFEQPPVAGKNSRAAGMETRIAAIANTLGEPIAAKRGGPMPDLGSDGGPLMPGDPAPPGNGDSFDTGSSTAKRGFLALLFGGAGWLGYRLWKKGRLPW